MFFSSVFKLYTVNFLLAVIVLKVYDSEGFFPISVHSDCYSDETNCNTAFTDVYKNLSRSADNSSDADTSFFLFTKKKSDKPEFLHRCGGKLPPNSNFNSLNELVVLLVPYFGSFCDFSIYKEVVHAILQKGEYNVLVVDWVWGSQQDYQLAIQDVKIAAKQTVVVLNNIKIKTGISKEKIRLVGISLGAQMAGFIGRDFPVGRITGIDPAGPSFGRHVPNDEKLDRTDADFVEVWHTNAGDCFPYLGINYDAGHVDFWINGGSNQLACVPYILYSFLKGDYLYGLLSLVPTACSHVHSFQYYLVSINPGQRQFVGVKYKNYKEFKSRSCHCCGRNGERCIIMGFDTLKYLKKDTVYSGRYYVDTDLSCPFCNNSKIKLEGFKEIYESSLQIK